MKKQALWKNVFREIRHSKARFLSIFAIIMLGVSFFAGIKATGPDMLDTAASYYEDMELMDLRVQSTYGLTEEDITGLQALPGVQKVQPGYSADVFMGDSGLIAKVYSYSQENELNGYRLTSGRLPERSGEIVLDEYLNEKGTYSLGDSLSFKGEESKELSEQFQTLNYKVVGFALSPQYIETFKRGTSRIGKGTTDAFAVIQEADFQLPVYSEAYLSFTDTDAEMAYTPAYDALVESHKDEVAKALEGLPEQRLAKIKADGEKEIEDGQREINEAQQKLAEAASELAGAKRKLDEGRVSYDQGVDKLAAELTKGQAELDSAARKLTAGKQELERSRETLENGQAQLDKAKTELEQQRKKAETGAAAGDIFGSEQELQAALGQLEAGQRELGRQQQELEKGRQELQAAERKLRQGEADLAAGREQLAEAKQQGESELAAAKSELEEGQQKYEEGLAAYQEEKKKADTELLSAKEELAKARQALNDLELPKVYVFDRTGNPGYAEYKDNADRLSAIASVFPVFFFLIAALVSLTTMTRMVEEQRLQIGTLKALGYSNLDVMTKFLVYGTLASLTASIAGLAIGFTLFPTIIYNAYGQLYNLPDIQKSFYLSYTVMSVIVALVCTTMTAMIASRVALSSNASVLMRPKAPKSGQRIMLERFTFLWRRLSFVQKVTARNLFRYKQRMFMTVIGVAGCTALILTGFGLKDSIGGISGQQFGDIMKYNALVAFHDEASSEARESYAQLISEESDISGTINVVQEAMTAREQGVNDQEVRIFVPAEQEKLEQFVVLQDRKTKERKALTDQGVVITEKLAKLYGLVPGDSLSLLNTDNEEFVVKVSAIAENYVQHFVYMTPAYYTTVFKEEPSYNTQLLTYSPHDKDWEDRFGEKLTSNERVAMVSFSSGIGAAFDDTMKSMDVVIVVLIVSAAALAFVVLYNLTNINVSERIRELSTIKVLGFYDKEVTLYIYRENILLSLMGILFGGALGILLHGFVLSTAELDATMFAPVIKGQSYLYAALLTLLFSGIVMASMHLKLRRIDMIEALKSVE